MCFPSETLCWWTQKSRWKSQSFGEQMRSCHQRKETSEVRHLRSDLPHVRAAAPEGSRTLERPKVPSLMFFYYLVFCSHSPCLSVCLSQNDFRWVLASLYYSLFDRLSVGPSVGPLQRVGLSARRCHIVWKKTNDQKPGKAIKRPKYNLASI